MRHLRSIFYALVLGPSIWVLSGVGFTHDLSSRGRELFAAESISGLLLLIFAGILFAILAFAPVSPAGPVLTGAAYLGVTIWAWQSPAAYAALWAPEVSKEGFDLSRPGYGLAALLAVPLLGTALSARRWARYEPPVLPIIGEIGRFRGAAKVAGIPVAIAETTVIRTGAPAGAAADTDRTVTMPAVPAATSAAARPAAPAAGSGHPTATPGPDRAAADRPAAVAEPTVAIRMPEADPTTVLRGSEPATPLRAAEPPGTLVPSAGSEPTTPLRAAEPPGAVVPSAGSEPAAALNSPAQPAPAVHAAGAPAAPAGSSEAEPTTAIPTTGQPGAAATGSGDEPTSLLTTPSAEPAVAARSGIAADSAAEGTPAVASPAATAAEATPSVAAEPAATHGGTPVEVEKDEETFVLHRPADDRTQPLSIVTTSRPETEADPDATRPLVMPAAEKAEADDATVPHGLAVDAGKSEANGDEPTRPHGLVTPPGEGTEPLRLPTEPTALIPVQRRPPEIES